MEEIPRAPRADSLSIYSTNGFQSPAHISCITPTFGGPRVLLSPQRTLYLSPTHSLANIPGFLPLLLLEPMASYCLGRRGGEKQLGGKCEERHVGGTTLCFREAQQGQEEGPDGPHSYWPLPGDAAAWEQTGRVGSWQERDWSGQGEGMDMALVVSQALTPQTAQETEAQECKKGRRDDLALGER